MFSIETIKQMNAAEALAKTKAQRIGDISDFINDTFSQIGDAVENGRTSVNQLFRTKSKGETASADQRDFILKLLRDKGYTVRGEGQSAVVSWDKPKKEKKR